MFPNIELDKKLSCLSNASFQSFPLIQSSFIYCYNPCHKSNCFGKEYHIKLKTVAIEKRKHSCTADIILQVLVLINKYVLDNLFQI